MTTTLPRAVPATPPGPDMPCSQGEPGLGDTAPANGPRGMRGMRGRDRRRLG
ncbi:hypothetical protein [Streptomyces sp. NPDC001985]|uniref:hypothetical protein n=1 Tax=Streptomyces sp. NPDC001985 TaxID=3154406 RepID=UPI0033345D7A